MPEASFFDNAMEVVYYNYRHYNQWIGKWSRRDPKYESPYADSSIPNSYLWCDNRCNLFDILGLKCVIYRFMGHYAGVKEPDANDIRKLLAKENIDSCDAVFSISCHMDEFLGAVTNTYPNVNVPMGWPPAGVQNSEGKIFGFNVAALLKESDGKISNLKGSLSSAPCCCTKVWLKTICDKDMDGNIDKMIELQKKGISSGVDISSNPCGTEVEL